MRKFTAGDGWRTRLSGMWVLMAPVFAMGLVVLLGTAAPGQFVVSGGSLDTALLVRPDSIFDDLARDVPDKPGVGGRLGSEEPSKVEIPITGTTDGDREVPPGADGSVSGIPASVLPAYQRAAAELAASMPACGLTWPLLAGIGKVESSHASGGRLDAAGNTRGPILGPVLNGGPGMAAIRDTDNGVYDGHTEWDRAVGPMQFIPGTWAVHGADGNADGNVNPHNIYDAAKAAGQYLCANGANLRDPRGLVQAVLRYNHSMDYVATVLRWMETYSKAAVTVNDRTGEVPQTNDDKGNVERDDDPTNVPTTQPTTQPTSRPTSQPTIRPTTARPPSKPATSRPPAKPTTPPIQTTTKPRPTKPTITPPTTTPTPPVTTTPTPTPCVTPTPTPTPSPTPTPCPTPCSTPTPSPSPTPCPPTNTGGQQPGGDQSSQPGGETTTTQPAGGTENPAPTSSAATVDSLAIEPELMAWAVGVGLLILAVAIVDDRRRRVRRR